MSNCAFCAIAAGEAETHVLDEDEQTIEPFVARANELADAVRAERCGWSACRCTRIYIRTERRRLYG